MRISSNHYAKTLYIWDGLAALFVYGGVTPLHSHNTLQIVFGIREPFRCLVQDTPWTSCKTVLIREHAPHRLDTNDSVQLLLYLDPRTTIAQKIISRHMQGRPLASLDMDILDFVSPGALEKCLVVPDAPFLWGLIQNLLTILSFDAPAMPIDPRIAMVVDRLKSDRSGRLTIPALASEACLSESRLRALFKKSIGVSLHRYIVWSRIQLTLHEIMNGATVEEAAIQCGFTDGSHFHKLLSGMFGVSPSWFIKHNSQKGFQLLTEKLQHLQTRYFDEETKVEKTIDWSSA